MMKLEIGAKLENVTTALFQKHRFDQSIEGRLALYRQHFAIYIYYLNVLFISAAASYCDFPAGGSKFKRIHAQIRNENN